MAGPSHEVEYELFGNDLQVVQVALDPGETVIAEAGAMISMEEGIHFEARFGDGTEPEGGMLGKLFQAGKRALSGAGVFLTHFTNRGAGPARVAFAAPFPGKINPVDLARFSGEFFCQKDAFLAAAYGTQVDIAFTKRFGAGLFGGEGFVLQRLTGDGLAFIHAGGTVLQREMTGETLRVDTGCLVGFGPGIDYDIERAGNLKSMVFGGEGLFLATLRGTGTVFLQSMPLARLASRLRAYLPGRHGSGES